MSLKYSKQREMIYDFLRTRTDHPTADIVYRGVKSDCPNISLGTVYRNLMLLSELGQIQRLNVGDGVEHFDPVTTEHNHFICKKCGRIFDLEMDDVSNLNELAAKQIAGKIDYHKVFFYGTCQECLDDNGNDDTP
ncbi:MAG: transcriptional repressor [Butyrivibrio sp.]|nr:transcriptional repressor [Butyrivibrio sp.]